MTGLSSADIQQDMPGWRKIPQRPNPQDSDQQDSDQEEVGEEFWSMHQPVVESEISEASELYDPSQWQFVWDEKAKCMSPKRIYEPSNSSDKEVEAPGNRSTYERIVAWCEENPVSQKEKRSEQSGYHGYFEGIGGNKNAIGRLCEMTLTLNDLLIGLGNGEIDTNQYAQEKERLELLIHGEQKPGHTLKFMRRYRPNEHKSKDASGRRLMSCDAMNYIESIESDLASKGIESIRLRIGELVAEGKLSGVGDYQKRAMDLAYLAYPEEFVGYQGLGEFQSEEDSRAVSTLRAIDSANNEQIANNLYEGMEEAMKSMANSLSRGLLHPKRDELFDMLVNGRSSQAATDMPVGVEEAVEEILANSDSLGLSDKELLSLVVGKECSPLVLMLINRRNLPYVSANYGVFSLYIRKIEEAVRLGYLQNDGDVESSSIEWLRNTAENVVRENVEKGLSSVPQRVSSFISAGNFFHSYECVKMYIYYRKLASEKGFPVSDIDGLNKRLSNVFTFDKLEKGVNAFVNTEGAQLAKRFATNRKNPEISGNEKCLSAYMRFIDDVRLIWDILSDWSFSNMLELTKPIEHFAKSCGIPIKTMSERRMSSSKPRKSLKDDILQVVEPTE